MDTIEIVGVLAALALGSGTGGILGAILALKRIRIETKTAETQQVATLREVDVEQFKALFPGGLGDAVEHWREEAKALYDEVEKLRIQRQQDHAEINRLQDELLATQHQLDSTIKELKRANDRIGELESHERGR